MNKKLLALALASASVVAIPAAFAQDATDGEVAATNDLNLDVPQINAKPGAFVNLGLGVSRHEGGGNKIYSGKLSRAYSGSLSGGYRWAVSPDLAVGPEIGYVYLGRSKLKSGVRDNYQGPGNGDSRLRGITLGGNLRFNLLPVWYITLRGGAFDAHGSGVSNDYDHPVRRSFTNNVGYYVGVGTGWDINKHWGVGLRGDYYGVNRKPTSKIDGNRDGTRYKGNTLMVSLTGEYRFW